MFYNDETSCFFPEVFKCFARDIINGIEFRNNWLDELGRLKRIKCVQWILEINQGELVESLLYPPKYLILTV